MRPTANWQYLLISQITRGSYMMHPLQAIGLGDQVSRILSKNSELDLNLEREDYQIKLMSESGDFLQASSSSDTYNSVPKGSTAVFSIHGSMLKYGTWCAYGTQEIAAFMREAVDHKNINSLVLDFDTGGGSVSAIAPLLDVTKYAQSLGKPVVAIGDMCCSAGIFTASQCDSIFASNNISSEFGSIGVMFSFWDVIPKYEAEGYKFHEIYSSHSSNKNEAFQMALKGEYDLIRSELLDPLAVGFQNHIKTTRAGKLNLEVPGIITGKTFLAEEAKEYGLIDEIGTLEMAIERAQQLATAYNFSKSYN